MGQDCADIVMGGCVKPWCRSGVSWLVTGAQAFELIGFGCCGTAARHNRVARRFLINMNALGNAKLTATYGR
jgi:hypothetical protein